mgnify:CR=1 FL=1
MNPTKTKTARERFVEAVEQAGGSRVVAAQLGCSRSYCDMIRAGQRRPGMRAAFAIQQLFGIRMQDWIEPGAKAGRPRRQADATPGTDKEKP